MPRLLIWDPQLLLTRLYVAHNNFPAALDSVQRVLTSLGFVIAAEFMIVKWGLVLDFLVEAFLRARKALEAMDARAGAKRVEGYARTVYRVLVGEDVSFGERYGRE